MTAASQASRQDLINEAIDAARKAINKATYITSAESAGDAAVAMAKAGEVLLQAAALRD